MTRVLWAGVYGSEGWLGVLHIRVQLRYPAIVRRVECGIILNRIYQQSGTLDRLDV